MADGVITIFRSRLRSEHGEEYARWAQAMEALARTMPGFRSIKTFQADDGERVSIVEFADLATQAAWRDDPRHREAQRLGRERFYSAFDLSICTPVKRVVFPG